VPKDVQVIKDLEQVKLMGTALAQGERTADMVVMEHPILYKKRLYATNTYLNLTTINKKQDMKVLVAEVESQGLA
jgi:hypothetical protein